VLLINIQTPNETSDCDVVCKNLIASMLTKIESPFQKEYISPKKVNKNLYLLFIYAVLL
jgi:hypothetical protein